MALSSKEFEAVKRAFMPLPGGPQLQRISRPDTERDGTLGQYAYNLIDLISKDYAKQVDRVWKPALNEVVAAFASAVDRREKTLKIAEAERAAHAAFNAFIFSLLTAGAMRFVGAYVQYAFIPSFKDKTFTWDISKGVGYAPKLNVNYAERFSKLQASAFGGIAQDIGNQAARIILPKPKQDTYDLASWSGVINLQTDLNKLIDDSAKVVLEQFAAIQRWLNDSHEFSAAWADDAGGTLGLARANIGIRIWHIRKEWADKWEFFGKSPVTVARELLAEHYERTLWAGYLAGQFAVTMFPDTLAEKAVVNRLKQLNVVWAESIGGMGEQTERVLKGAPQPIMHIKGAIDNLNEWSETEIWVLTQLRKAPLDAQAFQPEAIPRQLPPL